MKIGLIVLSALVSFNVSAKSLSCTASLFSKAEEEKSFIAAMEWMEKNKIQDESLIPEEFNVKPVKVDTRTVRLDESGDADLAGIIIDSYEKHGISYNYAAYAQNGFITYIGAENEVEHSGAGTRLKNQTTANFSSSSLEDGSELQLECEIK